jgi:serine/threonine-protein kinase HipA
MPVLNRAGVLGIFLRPAPGQELRIGTLVRDASGAVTFDVDETYIKLGPKRPIVSLAWRGETEEISIQRLRSKNDKSSRGSSLPPYFENLLPEGALLELVEKEFGTGAFDSYDVLRKLGLDLPGAIIARSEAGDEAPRAKPAPTEAPAAPNAIRFSIAGVQLKFSMKGDTTRLTMPAVGEGGDLLLKLPAKEYPDLPEAEYTALQLAKLAGVNTVEASLVKSDSIEDIPKRFLEAGALSLALKRFDRAPNDVRIHTEDFAQIVGAVGDQKYFRANQDTMLNIVRRFSGDARGEMLEGIRRLVVDIMVGNGDDHLKNWSFVYADGVTPRLSPAYDIVPTIRYIPRQKMALKLAGTSDPLIVNVAKFDRVAKFLKLDPKLIEREVRRTIERILDTWPDAIKNLPAPKHVTDAIFGQWKYLTLVKDVRPVMVQGHDGSAKSAE